MRTLTKAAQAEVEVLRKRHGGLTPRQLLEFAKDKKTALHGCFEWNNTEAAERYRLLQASAVIRGYVISYDDEGPPVRALVSIKSDRPYGASEGGNGRRRNLEDVLADETLRAEMLNQALIEMRVLRKKYERLKELQPIWDAVEAVSPQGRASSEEMRASA